MPGYDSRGVKDVFTELGGMANVQSALLKSPNFAPCHGSFMEELVLECEHKTWDEGENLWEKGGRCDMLFILWNGSVELTKDDGLVLYDWRPISLLGAWIFVSVHNHMATAKAASHVDCLSIPTSTFLAILHQHHMEKKHFVELAQMEASELLSDSRWVTLMPSQPGAPVIKSPAPGGSPAPGRSPAPSNSPAPSAGPAEEKKERCKSPEAVVISKQDRFHRRHSAPSIDVGHQISDGTESVSGASKWKSAFKRLPSIDPLMKASCQRRLVQHTASKLLKMKKQRKCMGRMMTETDDELAGELEMTCTMSENLAGFRSRGIGGNGGTASLAVSALRSPTQSMHLELPEDRPSSGREPSKESKDTRRESKESKAPDLSPASRKANGLSRIITNWFEAFDLNGNGKIDHQEFEVITQHLTATMAWDTRQSALLYQEVDTKGDGLVDVLEFGEWLTNVNATITVGTDGWLQTYDLADSLKPLYDCFDPEGTGISKDQFLRTYRVIANSLKHTPVPAQEKMDIWVRAAEDEYEALDAQRDMMIDFEDFVQWQVQLLNSSGTPNALTPQKVQELADALKVIQDIDEQGSWKGDVTEALSQAVTKVATKARELYLPCKDQLRRHLEDMENENQQEEEHDMKDFYWHSPGQEALDRLRRDCAIDLGVLLPGVMPHKASKEAQRGPKKSEVWNVARRNSHLKQRCETLVIGEMVMCVPRYQCPGHFLTWLQVPGKGEEKRDVYYEMIPADDDHETLKWTRSSDGSLFESMTQQLPKELFVLALLKTQEMVHGNLHWAQVQRSIGVAERMDKLSPDNVEQFYNVLRALARQEVVLQPQYHEQLELGMTVNEMVDDYLEDAEFSPEQVLQLLHEQETAAANHLASRMFKT
ncbi:unnamed protein product [Durusdinium trenchii]|uniref:Calmodulin n=1 Tax=Durusdinium trenchii TaxID=1381693 RepID=A0ABP0QAA1_9DINO